MSEDFQKLMSYNDKTTNEQIARNQSAINATVDDGDYFEDADEQGEDQSSGADKRQSNASEAEEFFDVDDTTGSSVGGKDSTSKSKATTQKQDPPTSAPSASGKSHDDTSEPTSQQQKARARKNSASGKRKSNGTGVARAKQSPSPQALQVWEKSELPDAAKMIKSNPELLVGYCVSVKDQTKATWRHGKVLKYNSEDQQHNVHLIAGNKGESAGPVWMNLKKQEFVLLDAGGEKSSEPVPDDLHELGQQDEDVARELAMYRPFGAGSQEFQWTADDFEQQQAAPEDSTVWDVTQMLFGPNKASADSNIDNLKALQIDKLHQLDHHMR